MISRDVFAFWLILLLGIDLLVIVAVSYSVYRTTKRQPFKKQILADGTLILEDEEVRIQIHVTDPKELLPLAHQMAKGMEERFESDQRDKKGGA
jgi:cbb3-type cytochrome oxidase subunit 3